MACEARVVSSFSSSVCLRGAELSVAVTSSRCCDLPEIIPILSLLLLLRSVCAGQDLDGVRTGGWKTKRMHVSVSFGMCLLKKLPCTVSIHPKLVH